MRSLFGLTFPVLIGFIITKSKCDDIIACGGFIKSEVEINFALIEVKLYTKQGTLKYQTDCAPINGYYMVPVYDKGEYVLKVEPPPGWTFEPQSLALNIDGKTDKCSRSEDVNFQFTGFGVVGKIISKGQSSGPVGVTVTLKKAGSAEIVQQTTSAIGGGYTFEKVLPGSYRVEASHPTWMFDSSGVDVTVGRETGNAGSSIVVSGYSVQGQVFSDGEPVQGVHFILFTQEADKTEKIPGCKVMSLTGTPTISGFRPLCYVTSSTAGLFQFVAVPSGKYVLVPFYKGENIKFDVVPIRVELTVEHDTVILKEAFQVAGFTVSGFVRASREGRGVGNAKIIIKGQVQAITRDDGSYHLDSMKAGSYQLHVEANRLSFDVVTVKITPNTPHLADIIASKFQVCGQIVIDKLPEGLSQGARQRSVRIHKPDGQLYVSVEASADGGFCVSVQPGQYFVSIELNDSEVKAGLRLAPEKREILVQSEPVDGITFTQFRAKVHGTVNCIETCGPILLSLYSVGASEDRKIEAAEDGKRATYTFEDVMPGKYKVSILNDQWCWKNRSFDIDIVDKNQMDVDFDQFGYMLSCSLSHNAVLNFEHESKPEEYHQSFNLTKGINKFCLPLPGGYQMKLSSCHQFEHEIYRYDTSVPSVLALTAVRHHVEGSVITQQPQNDIMVTISTASDQPTVLGPLTLEGLKESENATIPTKGPFVYKFSHWAGNGEKLTVTLASSELLFYPPSLDVVVREDTCPGGEAVFQGRQGVFVEGQIHPPLQSVEITVKALDEIGNEIKILTDANGQYKVGPLDGDVKYEVNAVREGYVFTEMAEKFGHFQSFKLAEIAVEVKDEADNRLSGVLLSLSGGNQYRRNNMTQDGSLVFLGLSPGHYFLKPMMKEYNFQPSSQMIEVVEGVTVDVAITGKRVAFSCYGSVLSLNGEPEPSVFVEAVGHFPDNCTQFQEESKTEQDGSYRIRGLQPGCEYIVQLKSSEVNMHIERSTPKFRKIQVSGEDMTGVNLIAFRRMNQMDLSGNVITQQEFVNTLKVSLYKESNLDSAIHSMPLGQTSFFYLPSIAIDNQSYIIKMMSTLPHSGYDYTDSVIQFIANSSFRHFTIRFDPVRKTTEQELSHSSFLVLPLTLLLLYIGYNYKQVLPFAQQHASTFLNVVSQRSSSGQAQPYTSGEYSVSPDLLGDPSGSKKKLKTRKA